jgi:methionyl-tRNA formyltransferase
LSNIPRSLRLGFAGTPEFAVPALDALRSSRHSLVAVFTQPDRPAGRGQGVHAGAVKRRALELGLAVHQPPSFKSPDAQDLLRDLQLDALVVVAYGQILPLGILSTPALGCFNIHASLLPRWRGAAPIQRALLAGDPTTGVTIMRMEAGLDTGPLLASRTVEIAPRETASSLHDRLALLGGELICETLESVAEGSAQESPQRAAGVSYAEKIHKAEAVIDWAQENTAIDRRVRAFNPWPVAETRLQGAQLRIWDAELPDDVAGAAGSASGAVSGSVLGISEAGIDVACGRGTLRLTRLQLAGRKPLAAREFIKAQSLDGARFPS